MLGWEAQRELTGARLTHEGILAFWPEESVPSLMTFPNPRMEYAVVLLRLHSRSSCQHRAALFSVVFELHKSKVYRFSYLDFCATAFLRRIAAFVHEIPSLNCSMFFDGFISLIYNVTFWMSVCWLDIYKTHQEDVKRRRAANDYWLMWAKSDSNNMNRQTDWQSDETFPPPEALLPEFPFQSLAHS